MRRTDRKKEGKKDEEIWWEEEERVIVRKKVEEKVEKNGRKYSFCDTHITASSALDLWLSSQLSHRYLLLGIQFIHNPVAQ